MTKRRRVGPERATLLDAHRARHCHGLAVEVEAHLEVRIHPLDNADQVRWHAELGEHCEEHVPWHRVKRLDQVHEQHPRLLSMLPPFLQSLSDAEDAVRAAAPPHEAVLLLDADLLQQKLQATVDDHRHDLGGGVEQHDASPVVQVTEIAFLR